MPWIVIQRGKYYAEMDADVFGLLCRQYAADGKTAPRKVGEADTWQEAVALTKKLQGEIRKEDQHAGSGEVGGRAGAGGVAAGVAGAGDKPDEAVAGDEAGVSGVGGGEGPGAGADHAGVCKAPGALTNSPLDTQRQGLLPAIWAQHDDVTAGVRGEDERLPVFTGERFVAQYPREAKIIVNLRFVYGFSMREIARVTGCSRRTVANVCRNEVGSLTAQEFRDAMASRLRHTVSDLMALVQERADDDVAMKEESLRDVVHALEKAGALLQQMESAEQAPGRTKDGVDPAHARDMEEVAKDYLSKLQVADVREKDSGFRIQDSEGEREG